MTFTMLAEVIIMAEIVMSVVWFRLPPTAKPDGQESALFVSELEILIKFIVLALVGLMPSMKRVNSRKSTSH